jgi:hypothetical protein
MRIVTIGLIITLAISIGWYVLQARDASSFEPPLAPRPVSTKSTSSSRTPAFTGSGALRAESARSDKENVRPEADGMHTATDIAAEPARVDRTGDSAITNELPAYLSFFTAHSGDSVSPNGCKDPFQLLAEMARGSREGTSASQMEEALQDLLERHPLGFSVSITCRAAICQISDIGPITELLQREQQHRAFWGNFIERLQGAPSSFDVASVSYFTATAPEDPNQNISGYVLTTKERVAPSESPDCARFKARGDQN